MPTFTARWGLRKPAAADTVSATLDLGGPYDIIDGALGSTVCTSSTRPGSPVQGQLIYETDTRRTWVWSGTAWLNVADLVAAKTADLTVNNTTTLASDPHLVLPVAANTTYLIQMAAIYSSGTTPDARIGLSVPAGATWQLSPQGLLTSVAATSGSIEQAVATANPLVLGGNGAGTRIAAPLVGTLVVAGTAGSLTVQFAQNTANASNTVLHTGSWLRLTRV